MEKHKRFLVFGFDYYYPEGGLSDVLATYDTIEECKKLTRKKEFKHYQVYDRAEGVVVFTKNKL